MHNKSRKDKIRKELEYLKIDIMRDIVYPFYHKWILHKGKINLFTSCDHINNWHILTPRLLDRQIKNARNIKL